MEGAVYEAKSCDKKYDAQPAYTAVIHPYQRPQVMYIPDLVAKIVEDENLDDAKCS